MLFILFNLLFSPLSRDRFYDNPDKNGYLFYTTPCASIASATFTKPAILAPFT